MNNTALSSASSRNLLLSPSASICAVRREYYFGTLMGCAWVGLVALLATRFFIPSKFSLWPVLLCAAVAGAALFYARSASDKTVTACFWVPVFLMAGMAICTGSTNLIWSVCLFCIEVTSFSVAMIWIRESFSLEELFPQNPLGRMVVIALILAWGVFLAFAGSRVY